MLGTLGLLNSPGRRWAAPGGSRRAHEQLDDLQGLGELLHQEGRAELVRLQVGRSSAWRDRRINENSPIGNYAYRAEPNSRQSN
jgi:hypothetical protein